MVSNINREQLGTSHGIQIGSITILTSLEKLK
jgi:hypothetical protein